MRRSRWRRNDKRSGFLFSPYRCEACGKRFFRISNRFESFVVWGFAATAVVVAVYFVIYVMSLDTHETFARPSISGRAPSARTDSGQGIPYAGAAAGDPQSQFDLGMMFLNGERGLTRNFTDALKWLELAAKQGHTEAAFKLGVMYKTGQGALQNFEHAFQWFERAAEQNHAEAQYNVALMYKSGTNVPVDLVKAYTWVNIAALQGHIGALTLRDNLLASMTPQQVSEAQSASKEWKPKAAKPVVSVPPAAPAAPAIPAKG